MNKINYILDLTNINLPSNVKKATEEKIIGAEEIYEKKRGKKIAVVVAASVFAFVILVISAFAIVRDAIKQNPEDTLQTTGITDNATERESTDDIQNAAGSSYIFTPLYEGNEYYAPFRTAARLFRPYEDKIVVADDLSPLVEFFSSAQISEDMMCDTFFAFYESGCVRQLKSITQYSDEGLIKIKEELEKANGHSGFNYDEIILLTAKNGTFEYLFTVSVLTDKAPGEEPYPGVRIYDLHRNQIGECFDDHGGYRYKVNKTAFENLDFSIYKIRVEMGLPVIYGKYEINNEELLMPDDEIQLGLSGTGLFTSELNGGDSVIENGRFKVDNGIAVLTLEENRMYAPFGTKSGSKEAAGGFTSSSAYESDHIEIYENNVLLCDYPYTMPICGETKYTCSRKQVCCIINQLGLQWFFPMYVTQTANGTVVIGDGIKTGADAFGTDHVYSSTLYRLYGTDYEDNVYTTYYGNLNENGAMIGNTSLYNVGVCYFPQTCDRPYFDDSYFSKDHALMKVIVKDGVVSESIAIPADKLGQQLQSGLNITLLKPITTADYVYIKDPNYNYSPSRPFSSDFLPFLEEDLTETPEMFQNLGFSVGQYDKITTDDFFNTLSLGRRLMNITAVHEDVIQYEPDKEPLKQYMLYAYEEKNRFVIDTSGCIYGIKAEDGAYVFTTFRPCSTICVTASGDNVIYSYCGDSSGNYIDGAINGARDRTEHGPGWGYVMYIVNRVIGAGKAPVLGYTDELYDAGTDTYTIKVDTMIMPEKTVFCCRETTSAQTGNNTQFVYGYYPNLSLRVKGGRLFWDCPSDDYAHGYCRFTIQIGGGEVIILDIESGYVYDE